MIIATNNPFPCDPNEDFLGKLDRGGYTGTAQDLKYLIDDISLPDQILVYGEAPITAGTVNIAAGDFLWRLNKVEYTNPIYSNVISTAATGYTRFDLFCVNNLGTFEKVVGDEEIGAAPKPSPNPGTLEAFFIEINGSVISDPVPAPSPGGGKKYIQQAEFASISSLQSGVVNFVILESIQNKILLSGNATELRSINHWANPYLFSGRDLYLINESTVDCLIKHLYVGQGAYTFSFPNEDDFTLHPKEQIHFKLKITTSGHGIYQYVGVINALPTIEIADVNGLGAELDSKLDASAYNQHFKGKFTSSGALITAHPTANDGDYAIVDSGTGVDAKECIWDNEAGWIVGGATGASTTDALPEGSTNLYHTSARVLATLLTGISFVTGTAVTAADSVLIAFGKLQKQITDFNTTTNIKSLLGITTLSGDNTGDQDLSAKQDTLVSGTNIKTKGGISLVGSGDIPNSAKITTTVSITNATTTTVGDVQEGKIVKIDNGVNVINYTVNGAINASFIKMGTAAITFVQGSGRTLTGANGTLILNGAVNSTASIVSDGTVDVIYINNL